MEGEAHIIIQIVDHPLEVEYSTGIESALKKEKVKVFNLDNYSDPLSIDLALKFIGNSHEIHVYIISGNHSPGPLSGFFRQLLLSPVNKKFWLVGQNDLVEKLIKNQSVARFESLSDLIANLG